MRKYFERLYKKSAESFYKLVKNTLKNEEKQFIVTANPETFMKAEQDKILNDMLLDENTTIVPDGIGIVKVAKTIGFDIKERIAGIDIATKLLQYGNELKKSIYLFGAQEEVVISLKKVLSKDYPDLKIAGAKNGYEKDRDKVFKDIIKKEPDIVLVALGIPEQEKLIYKHLNKFEKGIFVGVGGSFDVISGHKKRAPKIFQKLNLEWLYRILKEPKRIKRFYDSNIKFLFRIRKLKKKSKNILDILFVTFCFLYLLLGFFVSVVGLNDINNYENRTAYKITIPTFEKLFNKEYQDNVELAFSDQTPLSTTMKKNYNFISNSITKTISKKIFKNNCNNKYINMGNSITTFGCENNIVYSQSYISYNQQEYDARISNINNVIEKTNIPIYFYYIEKDTDIDFSTNNKSDIFQYLKENIKSNNIYNFEINNFDEFKKYFYKTDHHWNYIGSYKAYRELVEIITEDKPLNYEKKLCVSDSFSGSKAAFSGASLLYNEPFCIYTFEYPRFETYINGIEANYGNEVKVSNNDTTVISYGSYYGGDDGEIVFDTNNSNKENILILGESYDNAILKLLASHFNKTYSIDLRNYERENGKKFDYYNYITKNKIDKVLMIGNMDFYKMKEFDLEV